MTIEEQLAQINAAISAIETGGQEYRIGNRSLKRADLGMLYNERRQLQSQLNERSASAFGYSTFVANFDRR